MRLAFSLLFFSSIPVFSSAQNLVLNPGFESYDTLRYFYASHWVTPTSGTTDYFHLPDRRDLSLFGGKTKPNSGTGFAGLILYYPTKGKDPFREFTTGELSEPLTAGEKYTISFYAQLGKKCRNAATQIQMWLSSVRPEKVKGAFPTNEDPQVNFVLQEVYQAQGTWVQVNAEYTAKGGEKFFTVGNYLSDNKTDVVQMKIPSKGAHQWSYYYLDDFYIGKDSSIIEMDEPLNDPPEQIDTIHRIVEENITPEIKAGAKIVSHAIHFDYDSDRLKEESFPVLDEIVTAMKVQPFLKVEVDGFTDGRVTNEYNRNLSQQRADAVADYLVSKGIERNRIIAKGYGSTKPLVEEKTDADRAMNRRVEFIFSE